MRLILLTCFICISIVCTAQRVGINNTNPHASAALDIAATDKGVLIPRITKASRMAISSPANGLMVYQSGPDSIGFYYYHSSWHYLNYDSMLPPTAMVLSATANNARLQNNNFLYKGKINMPGATITAELPVASNIWQTIDSTVNAYPVSGAADLFSTWADSVYYLAGGAEAGTTGIDFYKFNPVTGRWTVAYSSGLKMTAGAAQSRVGNKWVFWGGYYNPMNNQATAPYIFDVATNSFSSGSLPNDSSRRGLMAAALGNNVYFWGGVGIATYPYSYSTGYYYNVVNNTWTPMNASGAPTGRMNAGAVAAGNSIVIWGGYNPNGGGLLANGGMYNTVTNTWTTLSASNAPPSAVDPAMAYYNGNVYIIAGN